MVLIVVVLNVILAVCCLGVAAWLWRTRIRLHRAALALALAERHTHAVLHKAPTAIRKGQWGAQEIHGQLRAIAPRVQQAQQILSAMVLIRSLLGGFPPRKSQKAGRKGRAPATPFLGFPLLKKVLGR
jgi:hypothetical protein